MASMAARVPWDVWQRMSPISQSAVRRIYGRYADAVLASPELEEWAVGRCVDGG